MIAGTYYVDHIPGTECELNLIKIPKKERIKKLEWSTLRKKYIISPGIAHFTVTPYMLCNTLKTDSCTALFLFHKSPEFVAKF